MKTLDITNAVEQALIQVFDAALKSGGMSLLQNIDVIRNAIQVSADKFPDIASIPKVS